MMKLIHLALAGLGLYVLSNSVKASSPAPSLQGGVVMVPPGSVVEGGTVVNVRDVESQYNPTGASRVPVGQIEDFNRQAQGLALQKQYNALRIQYAVPLENLINQLNSRISSGGYAGATLAQMKATREDVQAQLNKVWTDLLTPLRTQYQSYLR